MEKYLLFELELNPTHKHSIMKIVIYKRIAIITYFQVKYFHYGNTIIEDY